MRIGIDLGGTKIEAIALGDDGRELARNRIATPKEDYPGTIAAISDLVTMLERDLGGKATVGVGIPGTISRATGLVKNANSTWLIGKPLDKDLESALGRPVRLANDANCFAVSEAMDGAAQGASVVFGVILGTGVGGGLVVDGKVLTGANGIAGEWGHTPLPWPRDNERPGRDCYCGLKGCIETFLSGPALSWDFEHRTITKSSCERIYERYLEGKQCAGSTLNDYFDRLARALAVVINITDPDVIVLGGGVSNIDHIYREVPKRWTQWVFSDRVDTKLVKNKHGDSSGVRGAAWLWPKQA